MVTFMRFQESRKHMRVAIGVCCLLYITGFMYHTYRSQTYSNFRETPQATISTDSPPLQPSLVKPENITVSALIFYGRKSRVSSMGCYLERNMIDNGGWLDEVLWVVNTDKQEDLQYLEEIIASNPMRHKKVIPDQLLMTYTYKKAWQLLERGKYYVKIDDDVLWIDDGAIPNLVTRKIQNPNDFVVSGNIINNPPLGFFHHRMGALHPYFPEPSQPSNVTNATDYWKPSQHEYWNGPNEFKWDIDSNPPAWPHHRWLRIADDSMIYQTPVSELRYDTWGSSYRNWAIATQMHMSLFENIETDQLDLYKFDNPWIMYNDRIRINFMCVYSDDILDTDPENWPKERGHEDMIVLDLPRQLRRPVVIQGNALAAHLQYTDQKALGSTDLLKRYHSLARDRYCIDNGTVPDSKQHEAVIGLRGSE